MNYVIEGQDFFDKIIQMVKDPFMLNRLLKSRFLLCLVVGILVLKIVSAAIYLPISYNLFFADITKVDLLNLLNQNRQALGLNILAENEKLNEAAYLKAQDMVSNGYFAHQSPQGTTPWFWFKKAGYSYKYAGENLAVGFADSKTVYNAWFNSSSHKENLFNKNFTEIGTAIVTGFQGNAIVVVQLFGSPSEKVATATAKKSAMPIQAPPAEAPKLIPITQLNTTPPEPAEKTKPKVLAGSAEQIVSSDYAGKNSFYLRMLNLVVYNNDSILRYLSISLILVLLVGLVINGILMFNVQNKVILLRPLLLILILSVSLMLDKDIFAHIMPYQVMI